MLVMVLTMIPMTTMKMAKTKMMTLPMTISLIELLKVQQNSSTLSETFVFMAHLTYQKISPNDDGDDHGDDDDEKTK